MRIPTLDGWRAIAILMVIQAHFEAGLFADHRPFHGWEWLITGGHGVGIFFVLSGYLITSRLFEEQSLGRFYIRRAFRLWPVAWIYLGLLLGVGFIHWNEVIPCLLFYRNFAFSLADQHALTSHFWSLSVEEQFYLAWPALFLTGRKALWIAVAGIVLMVPFPAAFPYLFLLAGCVLAFAVHSYRAEIERYALPLFLVGSAGFIVCVAMFHDKLPPFEALFIAGMLAGTSLRPSIAKPLDWKLMRQIGACSYSLYIWQEVLLVTHSNGTLSLFVPIVGVASWKLIEQPGIWVGKRLTASHSVTVPYLHPTVLHGGG